MFVGRRIWEAARSCREELIRCFDEVVNQWKIPYLVSADLEKLFIARHFIVILQRDGDIVVAYHLVVSVPLPGQLPFFKPLFSQSPFVEIPSLHFCPDRLSHFDQQRFGPIGNLFILLSGLGLVTSWPGLEASRK